MMHLLDKLPSVLVFAGHDPSGGAGLMADAETLQAQDCHALTIPTAYTVQNTQRVTHFQVTDTQLLYDQFQALLEDTPIAACKIGMLGNANVANMVADCLQHISDVPIVLDPVIKADQGGQLAEQGLIECITSRLLPMATLVTPNTLELQAFAPTETAEQMMVDKILATGCKAVLLTGTHADTPDVVNTLFMPDINYSSRWPRLSQHYHGSGCTLASAIAGRLAHHYFLTEQQSVEEADRPTFEESMQQAVDQGLRYTWQSLDAAYQIGKGQWIPRRN